MLGGNNNLEIMETRDKIVDALNAVRLAMKFVKNKKKINIKYNRKNKLKIT